VKIAIYTEHPLIVYGGLEKVLQITCNILKEKGHEVRIITISPPNTLSHPLIEWFKDMPVYRYVLFPSRFLRLTCWLRLILKKQNQSILKAALDDFNRRGIPDLVLITDPELIQELHWIKEEKGLKTRIYFWDHGLASVCAYWLSKKRGNLNLRFRSFAWLFSQIFKKTLSLVDGILAISSGIRSFFSSIIPKEKIHIVFNPVEPINAEFVKPASPPRFIFVGRLTDFDKNLSFLIEGLSHLKNEEWAIDIIGSGPDEKRLKSLAQKLGLEDKMHWLGFHPQPFSIIQECTALLLTSRTEGFPMVLVEAIQRGIPVISSNCRSGPEDIVINGVNGYLFPEGNMKTFVEILSKVIKGELKFGNREEIVKTAERFSPEEFYKRLKGALSL